MRNTENDLEQIPACDRVSKDVFGERFYCQEDIATQVQGPVVLIPGLIIGFGFTLLGGYVAGRIAKYSEILHGGIVGGIGILLGLLLCGSLPLWYNIVSFAGVVPVGMAGGYFAKPKNEKALDVQQNDG